ncbi:PMD domain-containing protein [Cephalotus follicularis]|uniref:PMD domain-containing protein n=1 Tax=Cephalotus follicularis TaxID=3775 RepID=A0A1Q3BR10_CEPFO|nr:PMD domain-containing protein [Cephalotus follicularis]
MYVFPRLLEDSVNRALYMLAIKISKGDRFPLTLLFMGSLYKSLDLYKRSMEATLGCNFVLCFVDTAALQLLLWDHYRSYAPKVVSNKVAFRAWLRYTPKPQTNLLDFLDEESEFDFCPYTHDVSSPKHLRLYPHELGSTWHFKRMKKSDLNIARPFYHWVCSTHLSYITESSSAIHSLKFLVVVYSPHRFAKQLGYDQGIVMEALNLMLYILPS